MVEARKAGTYSWAVILSVKYKFFDRFSRAFELPAAFAICLFVELLAMAT